MVVLAGVVGAVAGVGAIVLHWFCYVVAHYALDWTAGYRQMNPAGATLMDQVMPPSSQPLQPWLLALIPAAGGLLAGIVISMFARETQGTGVATAIDAYHNGRGIINGRVGLVKILASAITLGTGGSGGREGPIALVGASIGSHLAARFGLSRQERRTLLVAGMGAGIGAFFRAPLAGAIFAVEVLYADPDFETGAIIPAFFATIVAYCVFTLPFGVAPVLELTEMTRFDRPVLLLPLTVLAGVVVVMSLVFVKCLRTTQTLFTRMRVPFFVKPAIGGLGTGLVAVAIYYAMASGGAAAQLHSLSVLGYGYHFLQELLKGELAGTTGVIVMLLAVIALGKILTTSLTVGSGGSAGVFGPSTVIGGAVGGLVGLAFQQWMPSVVTRIDVFVILGAAGFFSAAANTPVSTLIMVSEMTGSHAMLLPAMWVCSLAYLLSRGWSLFSQQVAGRADSPAHVGELIVDVLAGLTVRDAWHKGDEEMITIRRDMRLDEVAVKVAGTRQTCFPVMDEADRMCGYFGLNEIRYYLYDHEAGKLVTIEALAAADVEPLALQTDLSAAMARFAQAVYDELPVVDDAEPDKVIGLLRRRDVIAIYEERLAMRRKSSA